MFKLDYSRLIAAYNAKTKETFYDNEYLVEVANSDCDNSLFYPYDCTVDESQIYWRKI